MAGIYNKGRTRRSGSVLDWATLLAVFSVIAVAATVLGGSDPLQGSAVVVDGDSLEVEGNRIRLEGLDAPEYRQTCSRFGEQVACGKMARNHLRQLIGNREVVCTSQGIDKYDRYLAVCKAGDTNLNEAMVRDGWAVAYGDHDMLEAEARRAKRGLWAGRFEEPSDWRKDHSGELSGNQGTGFNPWRSARRLVAGVIEWLKSLL
ncbi:MAG: thermonuclease family protein [Nitratireductor sp.]